MASSTGASSINSDRWVISDYAAEFICQRMWRRITTYDQLHHYWSECLSIGAQRHPMVRLTKDQLKQTLAKGKRR